jgi:RimJ/RimL family protein N-acetyltransferase
VNLVDDNQNNPEQVTASDAGASVRLRSIESRDLPTLFEFQLDPEANRLAATHSRNSDEFDAHWWKVLNDPSVTVRAIVVGDALAGSISCFKSDGLDSIGYWIGTEFWGRGVATQALSLLLDQVLIRPLQARVAATNVASIRVLQKCGFEIVGYQHSPGDDRYQECEEAILELADDKYG